jgi:type I restriction enzyme S subunit
MGNWDVSSLKGKISIKHGFPFKSEFFSDEETDFIVLTPGNFYEEGGFKRQVGKEKFYTGEIPKEYLHEAGDLIVAMTEQATGLLGSCARVPESGIYLHNQRLGLITTDSKKILRDYVYHLFKTKTVREQIRLTSTGSKVKHTSPERIYDVRAPLPTIPEQQKIVNLLDALEKKIELNNRINAELEAMAKALYDYWVVQFDFPDANGKPYKTSGGKMIYNPTLKREIPEGWSDSTIGEIESNIVTGKTPSKNNPEYFGGDIPFITIGDIRWNTYVVSTEETLTAEGAATQKNKFLPEDSICVTCIASPGLVGFVTTPAQTNQQINSIICSNDFNNYYLYFAIKSHFEGAKAKTGNTFSNMNKSDFSSINILKPSRDTLKLYHQQADSLFQKIKCKTLENQQLSKLRDWLLPTLMNGQVTIK